MKTTKKLSFIHHFIIYLIIFGSLYGFFSLLSIISVHYPSLHSFLGYILLFLLILFISVFSFALDESNDNSKKNREYNI